MLIKMDLSKSAHDLPEGRYRVRVTACGERPTNSGVRALRWTLVVLQPESFEGFEIQATTMLEGPGRELLRPFLLALDPSYDLGDFETDQFIGRTMNINLRWKPAQLGTVKKLPQVAPIIE